MALSRNFRAFEEVKNIFFRERLRHFQLFCRLFLRLFACIMFTAQSESLEQKGIAMGKQFKQDRPWWFRAIKKIIVVRYKRPRFVFLGKQFDKGSIILSNHVGTDAPLTLELYCDKPIRFWGASEMNSGLISTYKYLSRVYYHEKKHWNLHLARLFCLIGAPVSNLFYKGLHLISTYRDARFLKTLNESLRAIKGGDNIVIFPEDSSEGYFDELKGFHLGFGMLCDFCRRAKIDVPIYVTYFRKRDLTYIVDAPLRYSELCAGGASKQQIAERLVARCNELGKLDVDALPPTKKEQTQVLYG